MKKSAKSSETKDGMFNRRDFVRRAALTGVTAAGGALLLGSPSSGKMGSFPALLQDQDKDDDRDDLSADTAQQIFTAALIAEDLATTFYFNGLTNPNIIADPNLANGGTATNPGPNAALDDIGYLRAALHQEITHANLLRGLIGGSSSSGDPVQTFFFPQGTFDSLAAWIAVLEALENAFIGAYLTAVQEFSEMASHTEPERRRQFDFAGKPYTRRQLIFFAKVAASICGVECEHRTLGRAIGGGTILPGGSIPADNLCFEQTDGLKTVFNGPKSAVAALTPFISGKASGFSTTPFSLADALSGASGVALDCDPSGANPPA
jgi:hypothetical protein